MAHVVQRTKQSDDSSLTFVAKLLEKIHLAILTLCFVIFGLTVKVKPVRHHQRSCKTSIKRGFDAFRPVDQTRILHAQSEGLWHKDDVRSFFSVPTSVRFLFVPVGGKFVWDVDEKCVTLQRKHHVE